MKTRKIIRDGDLFLVKLNEESFVLGIILHSSRHFKSAMLVTFFNHVYSNEAEIDVNSLPNEFVILKNSELPNYTGKSIIYSGIWKRLGNRQDILSNIYIPKLRIGRTVYIKDEILDDRFNEIKADGPILGLGLVVVEDKLREHFKL